MIVAWSKPAPADLRIVSVMCVYILQRRPWICWKQESPNELICIFSEHGEQWGDESKGVTIVPLEIRGNVTSLLPCCLDQASLNWPERIAFWGLGTTNISQLSVSCPWLRCGLRHYPFECKSWSNAASSSWIPRIHVKEAPAGPTRVKIQSTWLLILKLPVILEGGEIMMASREHPF